MFNAQGLIITVLSDILLSAYNFRVIIYKPVPFMQTAHPLGETILSPVGF